MENNVRTQTTAGGTGVHVAVSTWLAEAVVAHTVLLLYLCVFILVNQFQFSKSLNKVMYEGTTQTHRDTRKKKHLKKQQNTSEFH